MKIHSKKDVFPKEAIHASIRWREEHPELQGRETLRLVAGSTDNCPGWLIDRYGEGVVATHYGSTPKPEKLHRDLQEIFTRKHLLLKYRGKDGKFQSYGHDSNWDCQSLGLDWEIRPDIRHDFGLFLDTHASREWVEQQAPQKKILNLFAYTCAFGLVASKVKAEQVTNVDASRAYLDWGRSNAQKNSLDFRNLEDTVQKYMARHLRRLDSGKDTPYDLIIADPPAFLVGRGDDRLGRKLWPKLLKQLDQSGAKTFLLINNDRSFLKTRSWKGFIEDHLSGFQLKNLHHSPDCQGQDPKGIDPHYTVPEVLIARRQNP